MSTGFFIFKEKIFLYFSRIIQINKEIQNYILLKDYN